MYVMVNMDTMCNKMDDIDSGLIDQFNIIAADEKKEQVINSKES